ncbi:MAG: NAD(P)-dependent oxidoreductase [Coriobacteriales bacterium]|jgi:nucleoside-diphosphate-sugar epimerase
MNVLLIGGDCALLDALIYKYSKEGDRVYWVTGTTIKSRRSRHVFGKYDFRTDSELLADIISGISPDLIIYLGAHDANFDWVDPSRDGRRFLSGVSNITISSCLQRDCRIIFLSSELSYAMGSPDDIPETRDPQPVAGVEGLRGRVLMDAEQQWLSSRQLYHCDVMVLRLDHLYSVPLANQIIPETIVDLCLEAFRSGTVRPNARHEISPLYVDDAVEAIYRASKAERHEHDLYNVTSGEVCDELDIADQIQASFDGRVEVTPVDAGERRRVVLDGSRFAGEFGMSVHHRLQDVLPQIVAFLRRHASHFIDAQDELERRRHSGLASSLRSVWGVVVPVAESVACFAIACALTWLSAGVPSLSSFDFFLLYVLLFAAVYGQGQAVLAGVLSMLGNLFLQSWGQGSFSLVVDMSMYLWVAELFIVGLSVGYLKDTLNKTRDDFKVERDYLEEQRREISSINAENVRVKKAIESQVVNQQDSLGMVFSVTNELLQGDERAVIFRCVQVLSKLMGSDDVAIYSVAGPTFARLVSATSTRARALGNSVRYRQLGQLGDDLAKRTTYVNRALDADMPSMARGIYSDEGLALFVVVWDMPWERMTLSQSNVLTVACSMIRDAVLRSQRMIQLLRSRRMVGDTTVMNEGAFGEIVDIYRDAARDGLVVCSILRVDLSGFSGSVEQLDSELRGRLRDSDYLGDYGRGGVSVLLVNSSQADAEIVSARLGRAGFPSTVFGIEEYARRRGGNRDAVEGGRVSDGAARDGDARGGAARDA